MPTPVRVSRSSSSTRRSWSTTSTARRDTAQISYFDPDANVHLVTVPLPWSITLSTTLPAVSANLMAQTDGDQIGCRVTVNGTVREEQSANGVNAQTYCLVKSA